MNRRALHLAWLALVIASAPVHAGNRTAHRAGVSLTGNGPAAPSILGATLGLNVTDFLRLHADVGGYSDVLANVPRATYNYTGAPIMTGLAQAVKPIFYVFAWLVDGMDELISTGHVRDHLDYDEFWQSLDYSRLKTPYLHHESVVTYGGGAQLFIPGASLSPTAGASWARYDSKGDTYGLKGTGSHIYYSGGLDWQAKSGTNVAVGFNWCPKLSRRACGWYGQLGFYF